MAKVKVTDALDLEKPDYEHVGRHRARKTPRDRWIELSWLTLATVILSSSGYLGLQVAVNALANPAPTHRVVNGVDLSIPITVIDASGTRNYASRIGQMLLDDTLVVPYSRTLDFEIAASSIDIQTEDYRALAKRIQKVVGLLPIKVVKTAKYPIEVRLGKDYVLPAE
jgi:hypothetical protein